MYLSDVFDLAGEVKGGAAGGARAADRAPTSDRSGTTTTDSIIIRITATRRRVRSKSKHPGSR